MRTRVIALCVLIGAVAAACSVIDDGKVQRVDPPNELTDTLPPTTTTIATTTSEQATSTTGLETTTTAVQAKSVQLFYIASGKLSPVTGQLPAQFLLFQLLAQLQEGPPRGPLGSGLRSAVPKSVAIDASPDGSGIAQVVLPQGFFDTIPAVDQRLAIAQIVMTLLENTPGVGQVAFNLQVSGPGGELIQPGQLLTRSDYAPLLASSGASGQPDVANGTTTSTTVPV
jgi:hypothetical protein